MIVCDIYRSDGPLKELPADGQAVQYGAIPWALCTRCYASITKVLQLAQDFKGLLTIKHPEGSIDREQDLRGYVIPETFTEVHFG